MQSSRSTLSTFNEVSLKISQSPSGWLEKAPLFVAYMDVGTEREQDAEAVLNMHLEQANITSASIAIFFKYNRAIN